MKDNLELFYRKLPDALDGKASAEGVLRVVCRDLVNAALSGDVQAQKAVAVAHTHGAGLPWNHKEALKWWKLAARQGDAEAQWRVGCAARDRQDIEDAVRRWKVAAEQGYEKARDCLEALKKEEDAIVVKQINEVEQAKQGDVYTALALGDRYQRGYGVPRDLNKAWMMYQTVAQNGPYQAIRNVARRLMQDVERELQAEKQSRGLDVIEECKVPIPPSDELDKVVPKEHESDDDAQRQFEMGMAYIRSKEPLRALQWFDLAAQQGHRQALSATKDLYEELRLNENIDVASLGIRDPKLMGDLYPLPPNGFSVQGHNSDQKGLVAKIRELEAQLKKLKEGLSPALTDHAPSSDGNKLKDMAPYLVIDLSGGSRALHYPVSVLSTIPHCGWTDEYKTTKLVMRRVHAGMFMMGSSLTERGRDLDEALRQVTLTRDFYMGIFAVTQKQYQLVMGGNPSLYKGDQRPVEFVSYGMIRGNIKGALWPSSSEVDAASFLGRLRMRTGLNSIDLPTEAQWEYACRAGTRASYDMHGNVREWCLDWYGKSLRDYTVEDPLGPLSGEWRVLRGGGWLSRWQECRSAYRSGRSPLVGNSDSGFRLVTSNDFKGMDVVEGK